MNKWYRVRFGLRSAFYAFAGLAIFFTWFGYRWRQAQVELDAAAYFGSINGICTWDYEADKLGDAFPRCRRYPEFLRALLGDAFGHHVVKVEFLVVSPVRDDDLPLLRQFEGVREISFENARITDKGLRQLSELDGVNTLSLDGCQVDEEGILAIGKMRSIHTLSLARTKVTDDAVKHLVGLKKLLILNMSETPIGDESLETLSTLPNLKFLYAYRTQVSKRGVLAMQTANPECEVRTDLTD
ncbi:MAG: hypothetical protein ACKVP0_02820 [Pirellulaceae bacterium]